MKLPSHVIWWNWNNTTISNRISVHFQLVEQFIRQIKTGQSTTTSDKAWTLNQVNMANKQTTTEKADVLITHRHPTYLLIRPLG